MLAVRKNTWANTHDVVGYTLTPEQSGSSFVLVQVNPNQSNRELAATMAHELYVHALRFIEGFPYKHGDVPDFDFEAAEREAYRNYDRVPDVNH